MSVCKNMALDICIGVHVDDMLAVGPSEFAGTLERHDNALGCSLVVLCAGHRKATRSESRVIK